MSRTTTLLLAVAAAIAAAVSLWAVHAVLLNQDEVDYARAADLGWGANAWDEGSLGIWEFLSFGRSKLLRTAPVMSTGYDEQRDPFVLRHYHPPFVIMLATLSAPISSEREARWPQLAGAVALLAAGLWCIRQLAPGAGFAGTYVTALLTLWLLPRLFGPFSLHGWQAVWAMLAAAGLALTFEGKHRRVAPALLCASVALALVTLETGLLILGSVVGCGVALRRRLSEARPGSLARFVAISGGAALILVTAIWPAFVVKGAVLKTPCVWAYRAWVGDSRAPLWMRLSSLSGEAGVALVIAISASVLVWRACPHERHRWLPFLAIGLTYCAAALPLAVEANYFLPGLATLIPVVGRAVELVSARGARRMLAAAATTILLLRPEAAILRLDAARRADLVWLARLLPGRQTFMEGGQVLQWYVPEARRAVTPVLVSSGAVTRRDLGRYTPLTQGDLAGNLLVTIRRTPAREALADSPLVASCARTVAATMIVYDCPASPGDVQRPRTDALAWPIGS